VPTGLKVARPPFLKGNAMDTVTIEVLRVVAETDLALLLELEDGEQWFPKSVITDAESIDVGDEDIEIQVASWFADREGLV
jgi:hypothetical protein